VDEVQRIEPNPSLPINCLTVRFLGGYAVNLLPSISSWIKANDALLQTVSFISPLYAAKRRGEGEGANAEPERASPRS